MFSLDALSRIEPTMVSPTLLLADSCLAKISPPRWPTGGHLAPSSTANPALPDSQCLPSSLPPTSSAYLMCHASQPEEICKHQPENTEHDAICLAAVLGTARHSFIRSRSRQALKKKMTGVDSAQTCTNYIFCTGFVQQSSDLSSDCRGCEACAAVPTISIDGAIQGAGGCGRCDLGPPAAEATESHIVACAHSATRYQSLENVLDETVAGDAGRALAVRAEIKPGANRDPRSPLPGWMERAHCRLTPARVAITSTYLATHHDCQLSERSGTLRLGGSKGPSGQPSAAGYRHCVDRLAPKSARHGSRQDRSCRQVTAAYRSRR